MINYNKMVGENHCEVRLYDSVADVVDHLRKVKAERSWQFEDQEDFSDGEWIGRAFNGMEECVTAANSEWTAGMKVLEKYLDSLSGEELPTPASRRRRPRWSEDTGDDLCNDRLRSGQNFWRESRRQQVAGPSSVTLICETAVGCGRDSQAVLWRGAATVAVAKKLEEAGFNVEIYSSLHSQKCYTTDESVLLATCLKRAGEPINESALINATSGWYYRTLGFLQICASEYDRKAVSWLGAIRGLRPELVADITGTADTENTHVIDRCFTYDEALQQARGILQKICNAQNQPSTQREYQDA